MDKYKKIAEKVVVTFAEAGLTYIIIAPHAQVNKALIAGALGAGLSAVYNLLRESQPTIAVPNAAAIPVPPLPPVQIPIQDVTPGEVK